MSAVNSKHFENFYKLLSQPETPWEICSKKICKRSLPGCWCSMFVLLFSFPHRTSVQKPFQNSDFASWAWEVEHVLKRMLEHRNSRGKSGSACFNTSIIQKTSNLKNSLISWNSNLLSKARRKFSLDVQEMLINHQFNYLLAVQYCTSASLELYSLLPQEFNEQQIFISFYLELLPEWTNDSQNGMLRFQYEKFNRPAVKERRHFSCFALRRFLDGDLRLLCPPHLKILSDVRLPSTWHTTFGLHF